MQALKQAAREGDSARLDLLCETWSVSAAPPAPEAETQDKAAEPAHDKAEPEKPVPERQLEAHR
jgi:hypothetical protein